jgi:hypothetical protein
MIMPALPKHFHFATTYGQEWKDFWDGLWWRAEHAIENADELAIIVYSLPTADERARAALLGSAKKGVRLSICCANATSKLEQEFGDHEINNIQGGAPTFDGFLIRETARVDTGADAATILKTLSRLNDLGGKQGLLKIRYAGEVGLTFLSVDPPSDLPGEADDESTQDAITRSQFRVRFDEGTLIDGSDTGVISGRYISLIRGRC